MNPEQAKQQLDQLRENETDATRLATLRRLHIDRLLVRLSNPEDYEYIREELEKLLTQPRYGGHYSSFTKDPIPMGSMLDEDAINTTVS